MKPKQQVIYFLAGDSKQQIFESPLLQKLREREIEVLLLDDPIDEFCIQNIPEFEGKKLKNVAKGEIKLDEDDEDQKKKEAKIKETYKPLLTWWKSLLENKVISLFYYYLGRKNRNLKTSNRNSRYRRFI